jgi:hypothetical protein
MFFALSEVSLTTLSTSSAEEPVALTDVQREGICKLWKTEEMQKTFENTYAVIDESTRRLIKVRPVIFHIVAF